MYKYFILNRIMLVSLLFLLPQGFIFAENQEKAKRPNIVILLADDLGYGDLSVYGHPSIETPALDRLATEGQRWTNFYAGAPVCSPSRGSLMTGKLPARSGLFGVNNIVFWPNANGGIPADERTIAEALKGVGYDTAMMGKWHLGDKPYALPTRHGFDYWLGTPYSNDQDWFVATDRDFNKLLGKRINTTSSPKEDRRLSGVFNKFSATVNDPNRKSSDWKVSLIHSHKSPSGYIDKTIEYPARQEMLTKRYTERAVSFIKEHAGSERPFFLYVAYNMPHVPTFASKRFKGKSLGGTYGDVVQEIDWSVNEIRNALLGEEGLAKNTLLIFASDNGPAGPIMAGDIGSLRERDSGGSAGPLRGRKGMIFEGGMRSPGIFWWPGHIKPATVHGIGSLMDLYATALSLAGVAGAMENTDSIDLSSVFTGMPSPRNFLEYYSITGQLLGYRKGAWKVSFTEDGYTRSNKMSLYNLEYDTSELIDVSKAYPDILKDLVADVEKRAAAMPPSTPIFDQ